MCGGCETGAHFEALVSPPTGPSVAATGSHAGRGPVVRIKYAPGPCLLDLEVSEGTVQISVWGTDPTLPAACPTDPGRVGQHGLEIIMAVCQTFEVRREPVGKRVRAAIVLADGPGGDPAGRLL